MKYKRVPGIVITQFCGKYFLVTQKETLKISETAFLCLKRLEQDADIYDLCQVIEDQFEIDNERALVTDVQNLINDLLARRLLMRCTQ